MGRPNLLNSVKLVKPPSSVFDLSHDVKLSCNMGELVPVMNVDCIPGDRWEISQESLLRFAPLVSPMMHRCDVYFHSFFVPWRLLWPNFEMFITGGIDGSETPALPYVTLNATTYAASKLLDYLGLPDPSATTHQISAFHLAAYQFIFREYYRDQTLQASINDYLLSDGDNDSSLSFLNVLHNRCWEHDYFTSCLPFSQRGDAVGIPMGFDDVVVRINDSNDAQFTNLVPGGTNPVTVELGTPTGTSVPAGELYAETSDLIGDSTIRDLRRAQRLQEYLERMAVGGSRYIEQIYAMFGVHSSDKRLQRPEYITGSKSPVQVSEVLNTTGTDDLPQGNMAGHGVSVTNGYGGSYFCEEHGTIMCLMSVMPKTAYFQGIPRKFTKLSDKYQFFWNQFEHIGEQEVLNKEIYAPHATPNGVFGYSPRYTEYKSEFNRVSGDFRTSLLHWHMARDFTSSPDLNDEFVSSDPTRRVFAVTDESVDTLYVHVLNRVRARRLMSKYSTPHS